MPQFVEDKKVIVHQLLRYRDSHVSLFTQKCERNVNIWSFCVIEYSLFAHRVASWIKSALKPFVIVLDRRLTFLTGRLSMTFSRRSHRGCRAEAAQLQGRHRCYRSHCNYQSCAIAVTPSLLPKPLQLSKLRNFNDADSMNRCSVFARFCRCHSP